MDYKACLRCVEKAFHEDIPKLGMDGAAEQYHENLNWTFNHYGVTAEEMRVARRSADLEIEKQKFRAARAN